MTHDSTARRSDFRFSLILLLLVVSCTQRAGDGPAGLLIEDDVVFVTQSVVPDAVMQALFEGRVVRDEAGCLRLDSVDDATVVWPKDHRLDRRNGGFAVLDPAGRVIGLIGGAFRLGGGEVPTLHDGILVSAADRERAQSRCPGRFWIVGEVLSSG